MGGHDDEPEVPRKRVRGEDKAKADGVTRQRACIRCQQFDGVHKYACGGQGSAKRCDYFDETDTRRCYYCEDMRSKNKSDYDPYKCPATRATRDECPYFYQVPKKGVKRKNIID